MNERRDWKTFLVHDWQRRLTALLVGVYLLQYILWIDEEGFVWLPLTVRMVETTLLLVFLLELPSGLRPAFRRMLQAVLVLVYTGFASGYQLVYSKTLHFSEIWYWNAVQFTPWIWFTAGAFITYTVALRLVRVRSRIYVLILAGILAMALRDSFSRIFLWDEAAVLVFTGMSLIVVNRMSELKRKNPEGWTLISEYPFSFAVPVVLLLSGTVILASLAPDIRNVLTDPYTLWKQWHNQPVLLGGKLLDTPSSNLFTAASGYSRSDEALGGNFEFDFSKVMTVESTQRSYWRGETRSLYNGRGWEKTPIEKQTRQTGGIGPDTLLPGDARIGQIKTVEVKQTVKMENKESYPVFFGAYNMIKVESIGQKNAGFDRLLWAARSSELRWDEGKSRNGYPDTYTVVSQIPVLDEAAMRSAPTELPNPQAMTDYLQLPATLPARVKQLAVDLTRGSTNTYDKARTLEKYLRENYKYSNKPSTKGESKDFVDRFLFESKEGYCDYFSTSMAVLSRSIGIPARWVKGYAPGSSSSDVPEEVQTYIPKSTKAPGEADQYTVRNADAHSWVELYFAGLGWYPFEATAGFDPADILPTPDAAAQDVPAADLSAETDTAATGGKSFPVLPVAIGAFAAALAAAVYMFLRRRLPARYGFGRQVKTADLNNRVVIEYNKLIKYTKRKGLQVNDYETARETIGRWKSRDRWFSDDLEQMLVLFEKAKYSPSDVTPDELERVSGLARKLRKTL